VIEVVPTLTASALDADPLGTVPPFTVIVAVDDVDVGVAVMVDVPLGTVAVYVVVAAANAGLSVPGESASPFSVASVLVDRADATTPLMRVSHPNTAAMRIPMAMPATIRVRPSFASRALRVSIIRVRPHCRMATCVDGGLDDLYGAERL
jgi:hypothetical protein